MRQIWRDGELVPWEAAKVHVLSHSVQRGTLAFDFLGIHETAGGPALFRLPEHIDRLINTCGVAAIPLAYTRDQLIDAVVETARQNPAASSVKISVLIPSLEVEVVPQEYRSAVYIAVYDSQRDIIERNPSPFPRRPVMKLRIEREKRNRRQDILPAEAKVSANYAYAMSAKIKARREGFDDIILMDEDDHVAEAPSSNLFIVDEGGTIRTPPLGRILRGVTRDTVLTVAKDAGIPAREEHLGVADLLSAREAFVTASTVGCVPVAAIDDTILGDAAPGPLTLDLRSRLDRIVSGEDPAYRDWLIYF